MLTTTTSPRNGMQAPPHGGNGHDPHPPKWDRVQPRPTKAASARPQAVNGNRQRILDKLRTIEAAVDLSADGKLTPRSVVVLCYLVRAVDGNTLRAAIFVRTIAERTGLKRRAVERSLVELDAAGLVERHARYAEGKRRKVATEYALVVPSVVTVPSAQTVGYRPYRRKGTVSSGGDSSSPTCQDSPACNSGSGADAPAPARRPASSTSRRQGNSKASKASLFPTPESVLDDDGLQDWVKFNCPSLARSSIGARIDRFVLYWRGKIEDGRKNVPRNYQQALRNWLLKDEADEAQREARRPAARRFSQRDNGVEEALRIVEESWEEGGDR